MWLAQNLDTCTASQVLCPNALIHNWCWGFPAETGVRSWELIMLWPSIWARGFRWLRVLGVEDFGNRGFRAPRIFGVEDFGGEGFLGPRILGNEDFEGREFWGLRISGAENFGGWGFRGLRILQRISKILLQNEPRIRQEFGREFRYVGCSNSFATKKILDKILGRILGLISATFLATFSRFLVGPKSKRQGSHNAIDQTILYSCPLI